MAQYLDMNGVTVLANQIKSKADKSYVDGQIAAQAERIYTPMGAKNSMSELPANPAVGDIWQIDGEVMEDANGYADVTGVVDNYADLPATAADGAVYRVKNEYTDSSTDPATVYPANSYFAYDETNAAWSAVENAIQHNAGTDYKYTEEDGWVAMSSGYDMSEYATKEDVAGISNVDAIPVADVEALFA